MKRVVENQPQAPCQDLQFRRPLPAPPQCLVPWKTYCQDKQQPSDSLLQTLIEHIQRRLCSHPHQAHYFSAYQTPLPPHTRHSHHRQFPRNEGFDSSENSETIRGFD
jgi:hypothetical protein